MSEERHACIKCGGEMTAGVSGMFSSWGNIARQGWMELKLEDGIPPPVFSEEAKKYLVTTYRCDKCGYLESYATERHY